MAHTAGPGPRSPTATPSAGKQWRRQFEGCMRVRPVPPRGSHFTHSIKSTFEVVQHVAGRASTRRICVANGARRIGRLRAMLSCQGAIEKRGECPFSSLCRASRPGRPACGAPAGALHIYCTRRSIVICSISTRRFGSRHWIRSARFLLLQTATGLASPLPTAFKRPASIPLPTR